MDLSNGGIGLLQTDAIPADVWAELETVSQGIIDGSIDVPLTVLARRGGSADRRLNRGGARAVVTVRRPLRGPRRKGETLCTSRISS